MESVVENKGYSGKRKRVSKLRGEVSEGSTSLEASTYILPVNKELEAVLRPLWLLFLHRACAIGVGRLVADGEDLREPLLLLPVGPGAADVELAAHADGLQAGGGWSAMRWRALNIGRRHRWAGKRALAWMLYVPPGDMGGGGWGPSSFGVCGAIVCSG